MRLALLALISFATAARAQYYPPPIWYPYPPRPVRHDPPSEPSWLTVGGYLSLGGESHDSSTQTSAVLFPVVGIFADFTRHTIRPGLDLRGEAGTLGVRGTLLGPRVSANYGPLHPYAEFLLGPNHYGADTTVVLVPGTPNPDTDKHGLTTKGVVGIDIDASPHFSWRVIEFSAGNFSGIPDSHPQSWSTGIVIRLP